MQVTNASQAYLRSVAYAWCKMWTSPYVSWHHVRLLEEEAKRLSLLPIPTGDPRHVMRWRRKQVWLIGLRIRELKAEESKNT